MPSKKSIHSREYKVFLKTLRSARKESGLSQVDLAKRMRRTQTFVSKCERGERRIDLVELREFCQAIGVELRKFVSLFESELERPSASAVRRLTSK